MTRINNRLSRSNYTSAGPEASQSCETANLFAYGTLALDQVVVALLDRVPSWFPASVNGWRSVQLPSRLYPGLTRQLGTTAHGRVYSDLSEAEWSLIDAFEDDHYVLEPLQFGPTEKTVEALAYVWPTAQMSTDWNIKEFEQDNLHQYVENCLRWRVHYAEEHKR